MVDASTIDDTIITLNGDLYLAKAIPPNLRRLMEYLLNRPKLLNYNSHKDSHVNRHGDFSQVEFPPFHNDNHTNSHKDTYR